jgi:hypothetical protein
MWTQALMLRFKVVLFTSVCVYSSLIVQRLYYEQLNFLFLQCV